MNLESFCKVISSGDGQDTVVLVDRAHRELGTVTYDYLQGLPSDKLAIFYERLKTHAQYLDPLAKVNTFTHNTWRNHDR